MFDEKLTLDQVDASGALRESAEAAGLDRSQFLRRGATAGATAIAAGALFQTFLAPAEAAISSKRSRKNDVAIGNYALTLEYLESEFYVQAVRNKAAGSNEQLAKFAQVTRDHELAHVKGLKQLLGKAAVKKPSFDFGDAVRDTETFATTAQVLEDTGVAAYAGQGPNILQKAIIVPALAIHSVEARHAAWIRFINSGGTGATKNLPAPDDFDAPKSERAVLTAVRRTGFIKG